MLPCRLKKPTDVCHVKQTANNNFTDCCMGVVYKIHFSCRRFHVGQTAQRIVTSFQTYLGALLLAEGLASARGICRGWLLSGEEARGLLSLFWLAQVLHSTHYRQLELSPSCEKKNSIAPMPKHSLKEGGKTDKRKEQK